MKPARRRPLRTLLASALCTTLALSSAAQAATPCMRGINISGAEFGSLSGEINRDYVYPSKETIAYFASRGFNTVRLAFSWERLQPVLGKRLDRDELGYLKEAVELIRAHKMRVILDPHNYARYRGDIVGSKEVPHSAFADFWARLASVYSNQHDVIFGLMNEPNRMPIDQWLEAANAATAAIRKKGANNLILVPGTAWSGAHSWMASIDGEPNGVVMARFNDPARNFAFEVHQYLDEDFSGTKGECSRADDAVAALKNFTAWLKEHGFRGFLGEFGAPGGKQRCIDGIRDMVEVIEDNKEVWTGWAYWVAGDWWPESEALNIQPTEKGDRPMLAALQPALRDFSAEGRKCPSLDQ